MVYFGFKQSIPFQFPLKVVDFMCLAVKFLLDSSVIPLFQPAVFSVIQMFHTQNLFVCMNILLEIFHSFSSMPLPLPIIQKLKLPER